MTRRVVVTLSPDGSITAETMGVKGPACLEDVPVIQALARHALIVSSNLTPSYYGRAQLHEDDPHLTWNEADSA